MKAGMEMNIRYASHIEDITKEALQALFLSVEWESGKYPDELIQTIQGSHSVASAWDGDRLVGLVNALSDGVLTVYFHYMLIHPDYQGKGIGKTMMDIMLDRYKYCKTKVLISYEGAVDFYQKCGFSKEDGAAPMFFSSLV